MIRSMTAYADTELTIDQTRVTMEIRGYNSRYLDFTFRVPPTYQFLEEKIRLAVSEKISRGRIEIKLSIQSVSEAPEAFEVNKSMAEGYYASLKTLKEHLDLEEPVPLSLLAAKSGVIEPAKTEVEAETIWAAVSETLERVLAEFIDMKTAEGKNIAADLEKRLQTINGMIQKIESRSSGLLEAYQERLKERVNTLTHGMIDVDNARIAQEAAFLADKSDISEEIVRAKSHLDQFEQLMTGPEPAGRSLNFLLQEFNREFNTMGSKTGHAEISHTIVAAKTELEKIREQVQNTE
ncbi:MAG: YicC/YloC family endoribonuclease [Desulfobacterales bacterium]